MNRSQEMTNVFAISSTEVAEPKDSENGSASLEQEAMDTKHMMRAMDSATHLLGSKQDIVFTDYQDSAEKEEWVMAVFDGHGKDVKRTNPATGKIESHNITLLLIQELIESGEMREILKGDIYGEEDPATIIQHKIADCCMKYDRDIVGGSTMSMVQISHDFSTKKITVNVLTVGDSPVVIHRNGEKIFESAIHDAANVAEIDRLFRIHPDFSLTDSRTFEVLDDHTVCSVPAKYIKIHGRELAMTQSLGHMDYRNPYTAYRAEVKCRKGIFEIAPEKQRFVFDETDEINIKGFSDGVSDVMILKSAKDQAILREANAVETAEFAKARWQQPWDAVNKGHYINADDPSIVKRQLHLFGNTADDVCCVCWIQKEAM